MASLYRRPGTKLWWMKVQVQGRVIRKSTRKELRSEALEYMRLTIEPIKFFNSPPTTEGCCGYCAVQAFAEMTS